jgi:E3 ubiquitin-protein ligase UBR1
LQSTNLHDLVHAAEIIASIGLAVTVRSARDVFREQVCNLLCDWMKDIVSGHYKFFQGVEDGSCIIRDIICEELCREWALKPAIAALSTRYRRKSIIDDESDGSDDDDDDDGDDDVPFPGPTMMEAIIMNTMDEEEEDTEMDMDMYELLGAEPTDLVDTHPTLARRRQFEVSEESDQGTETTEDTHEVRREVERKRWHERRKHGDIADLIWDLQGVMQEFQELDDQETRFSEQIGVHSMAKKKQSGEMVLGSKMLTEFKKKLRLDYFMLLDLRLWKDMRMCLRKLFISTLIANLSYKRILGMSITLKHCR